MHRHRIRAFVTGSGETDVPIAIFADGQFLRFVNKATGVITSSLGPGTTTINALATWGDTTGTSLLNTSVLLDSSGNMTNLVTLDSQDAPNITAKIGADPTLQEVTVWASTTAPWKLGRSGVKINTTGDMTDVNTLNGRAPGILVGRSPTSSPSTNSVMVSEDGTGIVARGTPVLIDSSGNMTGVTSINAVTPGNWVVGPPSSQDTAVAVFVGTTGKAITDTQVNISNVGDVTGVLNLDVSAAITVGTTINGRDPASWMEGAASSVNNRLVTFSGTGGKLASNGATVTASGGALANVTDFNGLAVPTNNWVRGPSSSTVSRVPVWASTDGRVLTNTVVSIDAASGNFTGVGTINTIDPATWVVGPSSATDNRVARFDSTTGKLIQESAVTLDDSGNFSGAGTYNGVTVAAHAARHQPGGADPLVTGDYGDVVSIGTGSLFTTTQAIGYVMGGPDTITTSGGSVFVAGRVLQLSKRSAARKIAIRWDIPCSFTDSSISVSVQVYSDDNNGRYTAHGPVGSGTAAFGSSGSFPMTGYAVAAFFVSAGVTVPSGSGTYQVGVSLVSSGSSFTWEAGGTVTILESPA